MPTVEEKQHWDRHPKFVSLQRARDGWAWYTSNIGRLLPDYRDIDVDGEEERLPYLGNSDFYAWQQIPATASQVEDQEDEAEVPFLPSQLRFEQSDPYLPNAPTGSTGGASRRIQGQIRLPPLSSPSDPFLAPKAELRMKRAWGGSNPFGNSHHLRGGGSFLPYSPYNRRYMMNFAVYLKISIVNQMRYLHSNQLKKCRVG